MITCVDTDGIARRERQVLKDGERMAEGDFHQHAPDLSTSSKDNWVNTRRRILVIDDNTAIHADVRKNLLPRRLQIYAGRSPESARRWFPDRAALVAKCG
jgi:hypothetical protein